MKIVKGIFNVLGIILAWIFSLVLVFMLTVAPTAMTALSMLDVDTVTGVLTDALEDTVKEDSAANIEITRLSETSQAPDGGNVLEQMLGDKFAPEVLRTILSSNAAKEFLEAYTKDLANAVSGKNDAPLVNAQLLKTLAAEHIDEMVNVARMIDPALSEEDTEKLKTAILQGVEEKAEEFINAIPKPAQIMEEMTRTNPAVEKLLQLIALRDTVKLIIIGIIAGLSALIFLCRIPGFRGLRWISTDLFTAFGTNVMICLPLLLGKTVTEKLLGAELAGNSLVAALIGTFTKGMVIRTAVLLVAAIVLLVVYKMLKKRRNKKAAPAVAEEGYDIIILAGQSNAEGQGRGEIAQEYVPDARILKMTDDFNAHFVTTDGVSVLHYNWPATNTISVADEKYNKSGVKLGCFALWFAKKYADTVLQPGRKVLIVDANFGGTGFARPEWGVGNIMHERLISMTQAALAGNPNNRIVVMLWSQGEHDSFENADWDANLRYTTHKANLVATFNDIYDKLGGNTFPIIACGFTDTFCAAYPEASNAVLAAIQEVVAQYGGGYVDPAGLLSNSQVIGGEDIYHYSREALNVLSERFFAKYAELTGIYVNQ